MSAEIAIAIGSTVAGLLVLYCAIGTCVRYRSGVRGLAAIPHMKFIMSLCREEKGELVQLPEFAVGGHRMSRIELQTADFDDENEPIAMHTVKQNPRSSLVEDYEDDARQHQPRSSFTNGSVAANNNSHRRQTSNSTTATSSAATRNSMNSSGEGVNAHHQRLTAGDDVLEPRSPESPHSRSGSGGAVVVSIPSPHSGAVFAPPRSNQLVDDDDDAR